MAFQNNPTLRDENEQNRVKRYVHQPLAVEHYGIHANIMENGKVLIKSTPEKNPEDGQMEWDEVVVPASLIFKLATLLKATRTIKFVAVTESEPSE